MMKISWLVVTNLWVCEFLRHQSFPSRWQDWALALDQDTSCYNQPHSGLWVQNCNFTSSVGLTSLNGCGPQLRSQRRSPTGGVRVRHMLLCLILPFLQKCVKMLAVITTEIKELCLSRGRGGNLLNNPNFQNIL